MARPHRLWDHLLAVRRPRCAARVTCASAGVHVFQRPDVNSAGAFLFTHASRARINVELSRAHAYERRRATPASSRRFGPDAFGRTPRRRCSLNKTRCKCNGNYSEKRGLLRWWISPPLLFASLPRPSRMLCRGHLEVATHAQQAEVVGVIVAAVADRDDVVDREP